MATVTIRQFLGTLKPGANIVNLAYVSKKTAGDGLVKKNRSTGEPTDVRYPMGVQREAVGRFMLGFNYENNVKAQQLRENKEASFTVEGLWVSRAHPEGAGRHDPEYRSIVKHVDTGNEYLYCRPHTDKDGCVIKEISVWRDIATQRVLTEEEVSDLKANYLPAVSANRKQNVEKEIPVRVIARETLFAAKHGGDWQYFNEPPTAEWVDENRPDWEL